MIENTCYARYTSTLNQVSNFDSAALAIYYGLQMGQGIQEWTK